MINDVVLYENILPNLNANKCTINGVFSFWELFVTSDEYVLHVPANDYTGTDPDGNDVYEPYYTNGSALIPNENYDWATNPDGYEAILRSTIPPGVTIFEDEPDVEVAIAEENSEIA